MGLYWGIIGENTNNVVDLKAFLAGINMLITNGWFPVITEGDSQIISQMAMKLLHRKSVHKVVDNWQLAYNLEQLQSLLIPHSDVHTHHFKCKANKLVDILASHGVNLGKDHTQDLWDKTIHEDLRARCNIVMEQDWLNPGCW